MRARVNGRRFEASAHPTGDGRHYLWVDRKVRASAGLKEGARVEVELEVLAHSRRARVPKDMRMALARSPEAAGAFETLSPSHRRAYVEHIEEARRSETRAQRIEESIERLQRLENKPRRAAR